MAAQPHRLPCARGLVDVEAGGDVLCRVAHAEHLLGRGEVDGVELAGLRIGLVDDRVRPEQSDLAARLEVLADARRPCTRVADLARNLVVGEDDDARRAGGARLGHEGGERGRVHRLVAGALELAEDRQLDAVPEPAVRGRRLRAFEVDDATRRRRGGARGADVGRRDRERHQHAAVGGRIDDAVGDDRGRERPAAERVLPARGAGPAVDGVEHAREIAEEERLARNRDRGEHGAARLEAPALDARRRVGGLDDQRAAAADVERAAVVRRRQDPRRAVVRRAPGEAAGRELDRIELAVASAHGDHVAGDRRRREHRGRVVALVCERVRGAVGGEAPALAAVARVERDDVARHRAEDDDIALHFRRRADPRARVVAPEHGAAGGVERDHAAVAAADVDAAAPHRRRRQDVVPVVLRAHVGAEAVAPADCAVRGGEAIELAVAAGDVDQAVAGCRRRDDGAAGGMAPALGTGLGVERVDVAVGAAEEDGAAADERAGADRAAGAKGEAHAGDRVGALARSAGRRVARIALRRRAPGAAGDENGGSEDEEGRSSMHGRSVECDAAMLT